MKGVQLKKLVLFSYYFSGRLFYMIKFLQMDFIMALVVADALFLIVAFVILHIRKKEKKLKSDING